MEFLFKSVLAPILVILAVIGLYLGAYLPYAKGGMFISALQEASQARTVQELEDAFNSALNFYSPVGQQETERYVGDQIVNILGQKGITPQISQALTDYLDKIIHIDYPTARGLDFTQEYLALANVHQINWINTKNPNDLALAEKYYQEGLQLSPVRPQFLYGLLQLYLNNGDAAQALPIAEKIHTLWPTDSQVTAMLPEIEKAVSSTPQLIVSTSTVTASSVEINVRH
jgi:tetratricopeptide (TPR) repeat protein